MNEEPKKHIRLRIGFLLLAIAIIFVLFKIDLEKGINSPQFQQNVNYIEKESKILFAKYVSKPALYIWNNMFSDLLNLTLKNLKNNSLKVGDPKINDEDIDKVIKPDKIKQYFGNTSQETVNQLSSPVEN